MSTNGFISFVANGEAKHAYNHWDSMPDELGVKVLQWLRMASRDPDALRHAITDLKLVGGTERAYPTEVDIVRFHAYADREVGDPATSWYALLRLTQGDPAAILDCGCIGVEYDEPFGWIYEINSDEQTFSVLLNGDHAATWPWSAPPTDSQFLAQANALEGEWGAGYLIRPASQDTRLTIPADTLAEVLTPSGCDARPGPGYGDLHLQGDGFEISFSNEDDGWHVIIEGDLANLDTDELAAQIGRQIAHSTQTATEWLRFIGGAGGWVHVR
jgi:hypothetical protein